ncbi:MAG: hypothetical protein H5T41_09430 [Methanomassiliicoccales archaeon]|nr:hypothetical protein [Methanomassiliicoccales archaeon]
MEKTLEIRSFKHEITGQFGGYKIKTPIPLEIEYDHNTDIWCVENPNLELYGCGKTLEEALKDAEEVFQALIETYVFEKDENLAEDAKKLKKALLKHVEVNP